jgi:hypothetical protein
VTIEIDQSVDNKQIVRDEGRKERNPQREIDDVQVEEQRQILEGLHLLLGHVIKANGQETDEKVARTATAEKVVELVFELFLEENKECEHVEKGTEDRDAMDTVLYQYFFGLDKIQGGF